MGFAAKTFVNLYFLQLSVDRLLKTRKTAILQAFAVYKNRRGPAHTGLFSVIYIPSDQILDRRVLGICIQSLHIKADRFGYLLHFCFIDTLEVFKNFRMALPKFALPVGCQRNGRRPSRKLVVGQWKMFDNKVYFIRVFIQHLLEERLKPRTIRSLVITEDRNGDRRIRRPLQRQV